jgi:hypothetical protein
MYRIVFFDSRGRISAIDDFDVSNDEAALAVGTDRKGSQSAIEIWHLERLVGRLGPPITRQINRQQPSFGHPTTPGGAGSTGGIGSVHHVRGDRPAPRTNAGRV